MVPSPSIDLSNVIDAAEHAPDESYSRFNQQDVNVELLQQTLDHITNNRRDHDQSSWGYRSPACGTRFCFAGHAVNLSTTHKLAWVDEGDGELYLAGAVAVREVGSEPELISSSESELHDLVAFQSVSATANQVLGFPADQFGLFSASRTLHQLWYDANELVNGRLDVPPQFRGEPDDGDDDGIW